MVRLPTPGNPTIKIGSFKIGFSKYFRIEFFIEKCHLFI